MRFFKAYHFCIIFTMFLFVLVAIYYMYFTNVNKSSLMKANFQNIIKKDEDLKMIKQMSEDDSRKRNKTEFKESKIKTTVKEFITKPSQKKAMESNLGLTSAAQAEEFYYTTITKNPFTCSHSTRIGRQDDGGWDVCFAGKFNLKKSDCLSYSFGVNNIWEFDDDIAQKYECTVRTFDPSMTGHPDQMQRPSKVWFYKIGLGKEDTTWSNGWKIMKMSSILKKFNEEDRVIDILKIDIEFSEWDSFESMIQDGILSKVKQILFETHTEELQGRPTSLVSYVRFLKIWNILYTAGFRQWKNHWNHFGQYTSKHTFKARTCCFEHYLVNINYQ